MNEKADEILVAEIHVFHIDVEFMEILDIQFLYAYV